MKSKFAEKGKPMWAVVGTSGGIFGLFNSRWKATHGLSL